MPYDTQDSVLDPTALLSYMARSYSNPVGINPATTASGEGTTGHGSLRRPDAKLTQGECPFRIEVKLRAYLPPKTDFSITLTVD